MRAACLAVEDAARSEAAHRLARHRPDEFADPQSLSGRRGPDLPQFRRLPLDPRLHLGRRVDECFVHLQRPRCERVRPYVQRVRRVERIDARSPIDCHEMSAGRDVEIDADQRTPRARPLIEGGNLAIEGSHMNAVHAGRCRDGQNDELARLDDTRCDGDVDGCARRGTYGARWNSCADLMVHPAGAEQGREAPREREERGQPMTPHFAIVAGLRRFEARAIGCRRLLSERRRNAQCDQALGMRVTVLI